MTTVPSLKNIFPICAAALAAILPGCKPKGPRVYEAPKDVPFVREEQHSENDGHDHGGKQAREEVWRPALKWTLPAGWKDEGADPANVGRFSADGASVAITALTSMAGKESLLVNMWRQVRNQPPLDEAEAAKMLQDVPIAGTTGRMFEVEDEEKKTCFVVAFVHRPEGSLFFKIQGSEAAVTAQKPAFFDLLKSIEFTAGATPATKPAPEMPDSEWPAKVPEGWTSVAPGPMQHAKYTVAAPDGAKAEVTVSVFPSATGGTVENVKRWRGQLALADIPDDEVAKLAQPLSGAPEGSILVDLKNENRALIGAIVPRDGKWWFLKLMGDAPAVASAREAFVTFSAGVPGK